MSALVWRLCTAAEYRGSVGHALQTAQRQRSGAEAGERGGESPVSFAVRGGARGQRNALAGEPEVDRQALAETLLAVGAAAASVEGLTSIDVNPLIVVDGKPVAVDALVVTL